MEILSTNREDNHIIPQSCPTSLGKLLLGVQVQFSPAGFLPMKYPSKMGLILMLGVLSNLYGFLNSMCDYLLYR